MRVALINWWGREPISFDHESRESARRHLAKLVRAYRRNPDAIVRRDGADFVIEGRAGYDAHLRLGIRT